MNLDKLQIDAHIRTPWEAVDLGVAMTRRWWWLAFLSWVLPALAVFAVSSAALHRYESIALLVTWWFKPLYDRGPLYIASRRLFNESLSIRQVIWALPRLYRTDLIAALTWRRLSLTRSFDMPLTVLEGLQGKTRATRRDLLHRRYRSAATWLTLVLVHVELILFLGVYSFIYMMLPAFVEIDVMELLLEESALVSSIYDIAYLFSIAVVGPFYAISGFTLYICRRIELEAWDIEIRFRHLAKRAANSGIKLAGLILPVLLAGLLQAPPPAYADESDTLDARLEEAKALIIDVKQEDVFHQMETVGSWRWKDTQSEEVDSLPDWLVRLIDALADFFSTAGRVAEPLSGIASVLEVFAWLFAALLLILLIRRYREEIGNLMAPPPAETQVQAPPAELFGLDITRENLPDDIPGAVQQRWSSGEGRAAISLLYRGLLSHLVHSYNFHFSNSDTEGECVDIVKDRGIEELSDFAERITRCWQAIAYGHRAPDNATVNALCEEWQRVFADE